ncbi:MAG TPA: hypothetical protein VE133_03570, partial [Candidatus Sulfotelmatobacter sp.]|nr:hypothetical protein [Candidatus Sulfotelmatobacter sp.]
RLFTGEIRLKYSAQACSTCHSVQGASWGGSLGPELTKTYFRYQDRALTEFLRHPCFKWSTASTEARYLTTKESFSIKAFLRHAALQQPAQSASAKADSSSARVNAPSPQTPQSAAQTAGKRGGQ